MTEVLPELNGGPPPLSQEFKQRRRAELVETLAGEMAPLIVQPIERLIEERYSQPLGAVEVAGRAGYQDLLRGIDPALGADFVYTVPGGRVLYPLSVMARFTTSAVAGNRSLTVEYRGPDGIRFCVAGAETTLAASQVQSFCWQPTAGTPSWPINDAAVAALPQMFLYPTYELRIHNEGADVGDQIDQVRVATYVYEH